MTEATYRLVVDDQGRYELLVPVGAVDVHLPLLACMSEAAVQAVTRHEQFLPVVGRCANSYTAARHGVSFAAGLVAGICFDVERERGDGPLVPHDFARFSDAVSRARVRQRVGADEGSAAADEDSPSSRDYPSNSRLADG